MTMQVVQTSLSMIGFGFTITAFFFDAGSRETLVAGDLTARRLGAALLALGLLFLAMGIVQQVTFRAGLIDRHREALGAANDDEPARRHATPALVVAVLLLGIGIVALVSVFVRRMI